MKGRHHPVLEGEDEASAAGTAAGRLAAFLDGCSVETNPRAASRIASFRDYLRAGTAVYITYLRGADPLDAVPLARRLGDEAMIPVPHVAVRSIPDRGRLEDLLARLSGEAGVDQVLLIGGDFDPARGPFESTMGILETGLMDRFGIRRIGVAGHPEGNRAIGEAGLGDALAWKNAYARRSDAELYIVTQFAFDAHPVIEWERRIRRAGNRLPIHVGVPGPASVGTLLGYARTCGIGASVRVLSRRAGGLARLALQETPDRMLAELARYRATERGCGIVRAHVFPFGGLARTSEWLRGLGALDPGGRP